MVLKVKVLPENGLRGFKGHPSNGWSWTLRVGLWANPNPDHLKGLSPSSPWEWDPCVGSVSELGAPAAISYMLDPNPNCC